MSGISREEAIQRAQQVLLRDHGHDERVSSLISDVAKSRAQEPDVPPESSPEPPPDVTPTPSPAPDVEPESSPGEEQPEPEIPTEEPSDKELNFAALRESLQNEKLRRENLELENARLKKIAKEEELKEAEAERARAITQYVDENLPENFEEMSERDKAVALGRLAAKVKADDEFGAKDELKAMMNELQIMKQVPDLRPEQVELVAKIYESAGGAIDPGEAKAIAQARHPEFFQAQPPAAPTASLPDGHRVQEPSRDPDRNRAPVDEEQQLRSAFDQAVEAGDTFAKKRHAIELIKNQFRKSGTPMGL